MVLIKKITLFALTLSILNLAFSTTFSFRCTEGSSSPDLTSRKSIRSDVFIPLIAVAAISATVVYGTGICACKLFKFLFRSKPASAETATIQPSTYSASIRSETESIQVISAPNNALNQLRERDIQTLRILNAEQLLRDGSSTPRSQSSYQGSQFEIPQFE